MIRKLTYIMLAVGLVAGSAFACGGNKNRADAGNTKAAYAGNKAHCGMLKAKADCPPCPECPGTVDTRAEAVNKEQTVVQVANVVSNENEQLKVKDVVSGEIILVKADTPSYDLDGKRYYFSCGGCKASFTSNPAKFTLAQSVRTTD